MKKLLFFLGLAAAAIFLAAAVFLLTFDANRYLPLAKEHLQNYLGYPVGIERIALRWEWEGPAVELVGFSVYPPSESKDRTPVLSLERLRVAFEILPLLQKKIRISSVSALHPRLRLTKNVGGQWEIFSEKIESEKSLPAASSAPAPSSPRGEASSEPFSVGMLRVEGAEIRFVDETSSPVGEITLRRLDAVFKNPRLDEPFRFEVRLAVFGDSQNFSAHGKIMVLGENPGVQLEGLRLRADFSKINTELLSKTFPAVGSIGIRRAEGILSVDSEKLFFAERRVTGSKTKIVLTKGLLYFNGFKDPVEAVEAWGEVTGDTFKISRFDARIGSGALTAAAETTGMETNPSTAFEIRAERLSLASFLPPKPPQESHFEGELSIHLKGAGQGWGGVQFTQTLSGTGELGLKNAVFVNFNLLREVLGRLSAVPGFGDTLMERLPPVYQQRMSAAHTYFAPVSASFVMQGGGIYFNNIQAATQDFAIGIGARLGMDGAVDGQSVIRMQPELSYSVCQAVPEAQYFLSPQGQLEIPAKIDGTLSHLRILPDTRAIVTNIAVTKGQQLISDLLQKRSGKGGESSSGEGGSGKPDYKNLLKNLF